MIYGLIFSAGNETRFRSDKPKTLSIYNNCTILDNNIYNLKPYCDEIYIVCSKKNSHYFSNYNTIIIDSGLGCGDAVMKALLHLNLEHNDKCYVQWGDCLNNKEIINAIYDIDCQDKVIVPCVIEERPYVQLKRNDNKIVVLFSKYGEKTSKGYHDLGIFFSNASYLLQKLCEFSALISMNGKYSHKHGDEMQFLDIFNEVDTKGDIIEIGQSKAISFNTIEELSIL